MSEPAAPLTVASEPPDCDAVRWVVAQAEAELDARYGALAASEQGIPLASFGPPTGVFVVAREGDRVVGGVGLRQVATGVAEVKRLWTDPAWRGQGVARALMVHLEGSAAALGYDALWLATGPKQPEAVAFYETTGWRRLTTDRHGEPLPSYSIQFAKNLP